MNTVRDLRNAAAHSNCILNKMTERIDSTKQINSDLSNFIKKMGEYQNVKSNTKIVGAYNFHKKVIENLLK